MAPRDDPDTLMGAAKAALRRGYTVEAARLFEQAARLAAERCDPQRADLAAGYTCLARGDRTGAMTAFNRVLVADPDCQEALRAKIAAWQAAQEADESLGSVYICARVGRYRELARRLVRAEDVVVELGAAEGHTTRMLARRARQVIAVEQSGKLVALMRDGLAGVGNVVVLQGDADDLAPVLAVTARADLIFLDVGGASPPWYTMDLAARYARRLDPRAMIIRNTRLNEFVSRVVAFEEPDGATGKAR